MSVDALGSVCRFSVFLLPAGDERITAQRAASRRAVPAAERSEACRQALFKFAVDKEKQAPLTAGDASVSEL